MDIRKIRKLIELINETGIGEIEVKSGEDSVRISRESQKQPAPTTIVTSPLPTHAPTSQTTPIAQAPLPSGTSSEPEQGHTLKSPMVGTVYLSTSPGSKPLVEVGQRVEVGETICLIEAMKMFNQIEADQAGVISARLVENEQPVEFDQPLFIIDSK